MMRALRWPPCLFLLFLAVLAAAGAATLFSPACTVVDSRIRAFYSTRHAWLCAFSALSAACGSGLLTYRFDVEFTSLGRFVLAGLSAAGALAGAVTLAAVLRARPGARAPDSAAPMPALPAPPGVRGALASAAIVFVVAAVVPLAAELIAGGAGRAVERLPHALAAAACTGLSDAPPRASVAWAYALAGLTTSAGWPVLVSAFLPRAARRTARRAACRWVTGYVGFLALAALLITALEHPRTDRASADPDLSLASVPAWTRAARSFVLVASVSAAGVATEPISAPAAGDGMRAVLALVTLVGGVGGGVTGGAAFALFIPALTAAARAPLPRRRSAPHDLAARVVVALFALAAAVAVGLLILENVTASPFQPRPTVADALVDAASAVGGAGITAGLVRTLTDENLSSGMRQPVDWYPYAAAWLMLAMLIGRALPFAVLAARDSEASRGAAAEPWTSPSSPPAAPNGP